MTQLTLVRSGRVARLGEKLGGGGEASIFACPDLPEYAAKVFTIPPDRNKVAKLDAMTHAGNTSLTRIAAWPVELLADGRGTVQGFIMPRVTARRNVHELYSPKSRMGVFPEADFLFLTHVCTNITRAFAVVHKSGHVIGDVNHGNLLVGPNGTVTLIDCDSFQFKNGSKIYTCDVGTDLFTPPELHNRGLKGVERTPNHDCFGLAVLLFHLLFMGRHPFAGRYSGAGDMPIEKAIAEFRFAYGPNRAQSLMERPPGTAPLETMGPTISQYFVRAFSPSGSKGGRPDARAWLTALESLKVGLQTCSLEPRHQYPGHLGACPWCPIERQTGVRLFGVRVRAASPTGLVDLAALWNAILSVPPPLPDPPLPSERRWTYPPAVRERKKQAERARIVAGAGIAVAAPLLYAALQARPALLLLLALCGVALAVVPLVPPIKRRILERRYLEAEGKWKATLRKWKQEASEKRFANKKAELEKARAGLADLPNERVRRLQKLETDRELYQKLRYLDRFRIDAANVHGIGPGRTAMLEAYGVETAADVDEPEILQIPGFGPALTSELVAWRRSHEANFRFDSAEPVDPADIAEVERQLSQRRQELLEMLRNGPETLKQTSAEIVAARKTLMPALEKAWTTFKIAQADRNAP